MKHFIFCILLTLPFSSRSQQTVGLFFNEEESFNGYTLVASLWTDTAYLINNCGDQVHQWAVETRPGLMTYLMKNGDLLRTGQRANSTFSGGGSGGVVQLYNWDGNQIWNYEFSDSEKHQHHDVEPLPNGNILVISWEYKTPAEAIEQGRDTAEIGNSFWPTRITEIEPVLPDTANVVWQWHAWDHIIQDRDSTKQNFGVVADHPELLNINMLSTSSPDWLHCNAICYNPQLDQIVVSSRHVSEIYVIDHSTTTAEAASHSGGNNGKGGDILYRWGNPQRYDRGDENDQILIGPHDIHWIHDSLNGAGNFIIFNNGGGSVGSAIEEFVSPVDQNGFYPDPGTEAYGPSEILWHFEQSGFESGYTSGAQRLPNGNTLIAEGGNGRIFELNQEDSTVWKYVSPASGLGSLAQGNPASQNSLFRAYRYPADFPAFNGRDLTPTGPIELLPLPSNCEITLEPVDTTNSINDQSNPFNIQISTLVSEKISINLLGSSKNVSASFYNITGQLLKQEHIDLGTNETDISSWSNGIYFVIISSPTEKNRVLRKIIKQ